MSLWGFDGGENTMTNWSSLSQFDDMVWNDFGENRDHVVPDPNGNQMSWTANGDRLKKMNRDGSSNGLSNRDSSTSRGGSDSCTETSESDQLDEEKDVSKEEEVPMQDMLLGGSWNDIGSGSWSDLGSVVDLPLESPQFESGPLAVPQGTEDISGGEELKDQSVSILSEDVQLYIGEEDGSMVTEPFSLTEVVSQPGELEHFGDENTTSKAESLLDLGWANIGNLDDMDKLFRNNDTSFEPVMGGNSDCLEWPSSSPASASNPTTGLQIEKAPEQGKSIVVKVEVDASENKILPVSDGKCQAGPSSETVQASVGVEDLSSDVANPKLSSLQKSESAEQRPACGPEKNETLHESKAQRARRHAASRKRTEERFKRAASYRKLSPGPPYPVSHGDIMQLPLRMPGQASHMQRGPPPSTLQVYSPASGLMSVPTHQFQMPQSVPYIQVGYPLHHMSMMPSKPMSHVQYPHPMFVDLQPAGTHQQQPSNQPVNPMPSSIASKVPFQATGSFEQQQQLQARPSFDASCRPPTCSPSMTPQEKLEKLRWRQQMQARIAVEQQQQQLLASQSGGGIQPLIFQRQQQTSSQSLIPVQPGRFALEPEGIRKPSNETETRRLLPGGCALPATASGETDDDSSLEGSVLRQLELTISQLDIGTRMVIRNALYRLARSARKRRAAGGENGCSSQSSGERNSGSNAMESSTASDSPSCRGSRATNVSEVETETNPIDRTIAKLLFNRPQSQYIPGAMYCSENSPYPGVPQLPAGVPSPPWGWSSAAVPPNNGVDPPGPPPSSASVPWGDKPDERSALNTGWVPLPVMNGYGPPTLPGSPIDSRFGPGFPAPKSRNYAGSVSFAAVPKPEKNEETSISPVPSLQTESCSTAGHVGRTSLKVGNPSTSGGHVVMMSPDLEFKGDAVKTPMETMGDTPPLSSTPFVPDRNKSRAVTSAGVQEVTRGGQIDSTDDGEQPCGPENETPCITEGPGQYFSSTRQDDAGNIDQKAVLESRSFPTSSLDIASLPKDGMPEGLR